MEKTTQIKMSTLISKATIIYEYIKEKPFVCTYMTLAPKQTLVEKQILGLGLKLINKGGKDCKVIVPDTTEADLKLNLILSHYSMQMCPIFIPEGCIAVFLRNHFAHNKLNPIGTLVDIEACFEACKMFDDVLKNEVMNDYPLDPKRMLERTKFFEDKGFVRKSEDRRKIKIINEEFMFTLDFVGNLIQALIDTYFIVLIAIFQISGRNLVLKEKTLI